ncbi:MAG: hypothetical protein ACOWWH_00410 [Eubacteriaceae bacterium]
MNNKEKREEIFNNYKESIKKAKFAPLNKFALNLGNPLDNENLNEKDKLQVSQNKENFYIEYKIKKIEQKIRRIYMLSISALILSIITIIITLYYI